MAAVAVVVVRGGVGVGAAAAVVDGLESFVALSLSQSQKYDEYQANVPLGRSESTRPTDGFNVILVSRVLYSPF